MKISSPPTRGAAEAASDEPRVDSRSLQLRTVIARGRHVAKSGVNKLVTRDGLPDPCRPQPQSLRAGIRNHTRPAESELRPCCTTHPPRAAARLRCTAKALMAVSADISRLISVAVLAGKGQRDGKYGGLETNGHVQIISRRCYGDQPFHVREGNLRLTSSRGGVGSWGGEKSQRQGKPAARTDVIDEHPG